MNKENLAEILKACQELSSEAPKGPKIEAGLYAAKIIGIQETNQEFDGKENQAYRILLQYKDDADTAWTVASKAMKISLHEKSNFAKTISKWLGVANTPGTIYRGMVENGLVNEDSEISWRTWLGRDVSVMLDNVPSKKDPSKSYVALTGIRALGAKMKPIEAEPCELPSWFNTDFGKPVVDTELMDGFTIKQEQ